MVLRLRMRTRAGAFGRVQSAPQGPPRADCLIAAPGFRAVLSARNRMRRSNEFDATVKYGMRTVQPDVIVHVRRGSMRDSGKGPRVGLIIAKPVGSAVERHRVARRLRHVARTMLHELDPLDQVVIRAATQQSPCLVGLAGAAVAKRLETRIRAGGIRPVKPSRQKPPVGRSAGAAKTVARGLIFLIQLYRHMVSPLPPGVVPVCSYL